jgi:hypothetical protein
MFRIIDADEKAPAEGGARRVVVELAPDDGWIDSLQHDIEGALRTFRYLAQKMRATYDPADARGKKVMDSIDRHLATIEELKRTLVDPLFAPSRHEG